MGRLIPAGTGLGRYRNQFIPHAEAPAEYADMAARFSSREVTDSLMEDSHGTGVEPGLVSARAADSEATG
jgi:hypothetical protein